MKLSDVITMLSAEEELLEIDTHDEKLKPMAILLRKQLNRVLTLLKKVDDK